MRSPIQNQKRLSMTPRFLVFAASFLLLPMALAQTPAPAAPQAKKKSAPRTAPARAPAATGTPVPAPAEPDAVARQQEQLARDRAELERMRGTTVELIRALVQEGVLTKERAAAMLPESERGQLDGIVPRASAAVPPMESTPKPSAEGDAPAEAPAKPRRGQTVRVPYVPETVKEEIRDQIKQDVLAQAKSERWGEPGALPSWLDRLTFSGDFRLRYQGEYYDPANTDALSYQALTGALRDNEPFANTQTNVDGFRFRFRYGFEAKVTDRWAVIARLATGRTPVSANPRLGQYGNPEGFQLVVDRAAVAWSPREDVHLEAGRIGNPFFWPTDLVWYEDLNFEGGALTYRPSLSGTTRGFFTLAAFQNQLIDPNPRTPSPQDKYMLAAQGGADWAPERSVRLQLGAAYFHYVNLEGRRNTVAQPNANDWTVPPFRQKGNTVFDINFGTGQPSLLALASRFHILNLSGQLDLGHFDPFHIRLAADYAKNLGFDQDEIFSRTGLQVEPRTTAYQTMLTLGDEDVFGRHNKSFFLGYRYVEPDSVVDAFTQANVLLGGTNAKGYMIGLNYGLDTNVWLRWRWLSANAISGPPLAIDVLQGDLMLRF